MTKDDAETQIDQLAAELYSALATYSRENDARLRAVQKAVMACYPTNANTLDLLALMGWCLYALREAGMDPSIALRVLVEQCVELDIKDSQELS